MAWSNFGAAIRSLTYLCLFAIILVLLVRLVLSKAFGITFGSLTLRGLRDLRWQLPHQLGELAVGRVFLSGSVDNENGKWLLSVKFSAVKLELYPDACNEYLNAKKKKGAAQSASDTRPGPDPYMQNESPKQKHTLRKAASWLTRHALRFFLRTLGRLSLRLQNITITCGSDRFEILSWDSQIDVQVRDKIYEEDQYSIACRLRTAFRDLRLAVEADRESDTRSWPPSATGSLDINHIQCQTSFEHCLFGPAKDSWARTVEVELSVGSINGLFVSPSPLLRCVRRRYLPVETDHAKSTSSQPSSERKKASTPQPKIRLSIATLACEVVQYPRLVQMIETPEITKLQLHFGVRCLSVSRVWEKGARVSCEGWIPPQADTMLLQFATEHASCELRWNDAKVSSSVFEISSVKSILATNIQQSISDAFSEGPFIFSQVSIQSMSCVQDLSMMKATHSAAPSSVMKQSGGSQSSERTGRCLQIPRTFISITFGGGSVAVQRPLEGDTMIMLLPRLEASFTGDNHWLGRSTFHSLQMAARSEAKEMQKSATKKSPLVPLSDLDSAFVFEGTGRISEMQVFHVADSKASQLSQSRQDIAQITNIAIHTSGQVFGREANADGTGFGNEVVTGPQCHLPSLHLQRTLMDFSIQVEDVGLSLTEFDDISFTSQIIDTLNYFQHTGQSTSRHREEVAPLAKVQQSIAGCVSVKRFHALLASVDPSDQTQKPRGLATEINAAFFDICAVRWPTPRPDFVARQALGVRQDIRQQALAVAKHGSPVVCRFTLTSCIASAILDVREQRNAKAHLLCVEDTWSNDLDEEGRAPHASDADRDVQFSRRQTRQLIATEEINIYTTLAHVSPGPELRYDIVLETPLVTNRISLSHIYCFMLALQAIRLIHSIRRSVGEAGKTQTAKSTVLVRLEIAHHHVFLTLPKRVRLFLACTRLAVLKQEHPLWSVLGEQLSMAGRSQAAGRCWDELGRAKDFKITSEYHATANLNTLISLQADGLRVRIPHKYVFARIIDNIGNLVKATKQLLHQIVKGRPGFVIEPHAEGPKKLPMIQISLRLLALEAEDDPFETKLNMIWRAGLSEARARQDRDVAFDSKVAAIEKVQREANKVDEGEEIEDLGDDPAALSRKLAWRYKRHLSAEHKISIPEAAQRLQCFNSASWSRRIRNASTAQVRREEASLLRIYGSGAAYKAGDEKLPVVISKTNKATPLLRAMFSEIRLTLDKPTFGYDNLTQWLHSTGKGLPKETLYTLLIPLHISWHMSETRIQLRDYPLPLLHVPPMHHSQSDREQTWACESDFVIAEELQGNESIRRVPCMLLPSQKSTVSSAPIAIVVPRTASPVKTYAIPLITINSAYPTRLAWGVSLQPAIQDVIRIIDSLTKPSADPSDRIGFWDKIRLILHWKLLFHFKGEGDVQFTLKGSRDPYVILGTGAGFVKCYRGNVKFFLGYDNAEKEFFQITSRAYLLAIPDMKDYIDEAAEGAHTNPSKPSDSEKKQDAKVAFSSGRYKKQAVFRKVWIKLTGGIRWGCGLLFERTCDESCHKCRGNRRHRECRFFTFQPHYKVVLRTEQHMPLDHGRQCDSYKGFRSDFIHFSISVVSPDDPANVLASEKTLESDSPSGYNSFHFTPKSFAHFWAWWRMFDGALSLPVRQGTLYPSVQSPSKKFGQHLATLKYKLCLSPLYIAHLYPQDSVRDWARGRTSLLGLKGKVSTFSLDMHQREQPVIIQLPQINAAKKTHHKEFYQAELDCVELQLRAISGRFEDPAKELIAKGGSFAHQIGEDGEDYESESDNDDDMPAQSKTPADRSLKDGDLEWVDMDDFVETDWSPPPIIPLMQILPFAYSPRFNYFRRTGEEFDAVTDSALKSKFGDEETHTCQMGKAKEPYAVQFALAKQRIKIIDEEIGSISSQLEGKDHSQFSAQKIARLERQRINLYSRKEPIHAVSRQLRELQSRKTADLGNTSNEHKGSTEPASHSQTIFDRLKSAIVGNKEHFVNRYLIHNLQIFLNNSTRNMILKYYYSSRYQKGTTYHMTARAIKFIRDLSTESQRRLEQAAREGLERRHSIIDLNESSPSDKDASSMGSEGEISTGVDPAYGLTDQQVLQNTYIFQVINLQINMQSEVDPLTSVIIASSRTQLRTYDVIDKRFTDDPVNAKVLSRSFLKLDEPQMWHAHRDDFKSNESNVYSTNNFGVSSVANWPCWIPLETLLDAKLSGPFERIVNRTGLSLRYDKLNALRLNNLYENDGCADAQSGADVHKSMRDLISLECDKFDIIADTDHYISLYNIVTDLLLHKDPAQRVRADRLEALVLAYDFSDLGGMVDVIGALQSRIRAGQDVAQQFNVPKDDLRKQLELLAIKAEILDLRSELYLTMEALTIAQNRGTTRNEEKPAVVFEVRAEEFSWTMTREKEQAFVEWTIRDAAFTWINRQDNSIYNRMIIKELQLSNRNPNPVFKTMLSRFDQSDQQEQDSEDMLDVIWIIRDPVGGIPIIEEFRLKIHPVRLSVEHKVARQIINYIFSQRNSRTSNSGSDKAQPNDSDQEDHHSRSDANEMKDRASTNRTFGLVNIPSTIFCLSYQGQKKKNITDLFGFVFRTPSFVYRNKTWTYLDLVHELKKDVFRALLSHTGALLKEKITQHRPRPGEASLQAAASPISSSHVHQNKKGGFKDRVFSARHS